jgi:hypothetical protein
MMDQYAKAKTTLLLMLSRCRKVTICLDGWTAKGLASSYLGISACFFDSSSGKPAHATLNLYRLPHPHTGIAISEALENCLHEWEIPTCKVHLIVTDNGANIVKAIQILQEKESLRLKAETEVLDDADSQTGNSGFDIDLTDLDSDHEHDNSQLETGLENEETNEEDNDSDTEESIDLPDVVPY